MSNYKFEFTKNTYSKGFRNLLIYAGFEKESCLSKDFQVHHLNHNREDNHFTNLVLIDKKFHMKYHRLCKLWYFKINEIENPHLITEYELEFVLWEKIGMDSDNPYKEYIMRDYQTLVDEFIPCVRKIREIASYQNSRIAKAILRIG